MAQDKGEGEPVPEMLQGNLSPMARMTHPTDALILAIVTRAAKDSRSRVITKADPATNWLLSTGLDWLGIICPGTDTRAASEVLISRARSRRVTYQEPQEEWHRPKGDKKNGRA